MITHALGYQTKLPPKAIRETDLYTELKLTEIFSRPSRTGIWYDPQDLTTLFQDATGTLPVYRPGTGLVDPPVGLLLDKGGGGYHASQTTTTARPTLSGRYNLLLATETLSTQGITTATTTYTLRFEGTGTITLSGTAIGTLSAGTHTITCTAGTLTLTVAGSVTRADLRVKRDGSRLPAYQSVTNANTYDTAGFPLFLKRDKVDDDLIVQAPAITGAWAHGTIDGPVIGTVAIPAGEYRPFGTGLTYGLPDCTQWIAINGPLSASEQAVFERYVYSKARQLIDVPQFGGVSNVSAYLRARSEITTIDATYWDTSNATTPNHLLFTCTNLALIDVSGWATGKFTTLTALFYGCNKLKEVDVSGWDTGSCTEAVSAFNSCNTIPSLDISGWDCSKITSFASFANACLELATVTVGNALDNTPCTNFTTAFTSTKLNQASIDAILVSINNAGTSNGTFNQSGGSAPSATGQAAITAMRSRGWTVTVTGGF